MKSNKLLCVLALIIINLYFTGCAKWITISDYYDFPIWKQPSDTFYCIEIEHKEKHTYPIDLSLILDTEFNSYLINSDLNGNANRVSLLSSSEYYRVISISISGDLVVYEKSDYSICSMKIDGTDNKELIAGSYIPWAIYSQSHFSCLSNDGEKIVYEVYKESEQEMEIWLMDATGTNKYKIYTSTNTLTSPIWSSDNKEVGFPDSNDNYGIRIINIETLDNYFIAANLVFDFMPDNQKIIFIEPAKSSYMSTINKDITNETFLFSDPNLYWIYHIRISPDESKVLLRYYRDGESKICIINIDGTDYKEILLPKHETKSFLQNLF